MIKNLGNSSVKIAAIGQGTGDNFSQVKNDKKIIDILQLGINLGMNLVDTAENYGNGRSEVIIGKAIKRMRNKVIIATKFSSEHSKKKQVIAAVDGSLRRLGTDYIDIYQSHWPNPQVNFDETLSACNRLIELGKIRYIGMGNFSKREIDICLKILGNDKIVSLQTEYNLFERTIEHNGVLELCKKRGLSLIAYSPLDQGRLNLRGNILLESLSKKYTKTIAQIILRWLIDQPCVIAIPKTLNRKHLIENYGSMSFNLEKVDIQKINNTFFLPIRYIPIDEIHISKHGEQNHPVYQTLKEAIENKFRFVPSPHDLSENIKSGGFLKPVRLVPIKRNAQFKYDLIGGRIRYWAWVISYGNKKPIPAYVREDLSTN